MLIYRAVHADGSSLEMPTQIQTDLLDFGEMQLSPVHFMGLSTSLSAERRNVCGLGRLPDGHRVVFLFWETMMYPSGHFDPNSPAGWYSEWTEMFKCGMSVFDRLYYFMLLIKPSRFMFTLKETTGLWNAIAKYSAWLVLGERGEDTLYVGYTTCFPSVFKLHFPLELAVLAGLDANQCGQSVYLSSLLVGSVSQPLSLVHLFLSAGCLKYYYRLRPLRPSQVTWGNNRQELITGYIRVSRFCLPCTSLLAAVRGKLQCKRAD